ncbi:MAG: ABC transporter ATP-binding protein [Gammaproteobacteria bacterium]
MSAGHVVTSATADRPLLEIRGATRRYGARTVLHEVSLALARGEALALAGVNGAGKTTLIRALLDLGHLDAGTVRIAGRPHRDRRARRVLGYLGERFNPPAFASGREYLRYLLALDGIRLDAGAMVREAAALELDATALDMPLGTWSKGMSQKLGLIALVLAGKPLLVLDEPMSGLDPRARALIKARLRALNAAGTALFFSTHLLADIDDLAPRLALLHGGRLVFDGTPAALCQATGATTVEEAFLRLTQP